MTPHNTVDAERLRALLSAMQDAADRDECHNLSAAIGVALIELDAARAEPQGKAERVGCVSCEGRPSAENTPCITCGATPPTGEDTAAARDVVPRTHSGPLHSRVEALANVLRDCGRLVSSSGNAERVLREAAAALAQRPAAPREGVRCAICGEDEPYTGTCGSSDPRALCKQPREGVRGSGEVVAMRWRGLDGEWCQWRDYSPDRQGDVVRQGLEVQLAYDPLYTRSEDARDGEDAARYRALRRGRSDVHGDCYAMVFAGDGDYPVKGVELDCLTDRMIRRAARTQEGK